MRSRVILAMFMAIAMIASIGVVPVAAVSAAAVNASVPGSRAIVNGILEDLRASNLLERWIGDSGTPRRLGPVVSSEPVELILGLEGRSLAAEQAYRREAGLPTLDAAGQRAYVAALRATQAGVRASLEAIGVRVLYGYQVVYNGLAISAAPSTLDRVGGFANIVRVERSQVFDIELDNSVPFIYGGQTNTDLGVDGTGVTIAIIDTGIDYTHADFGGPGTEAAWSSNDRTIIEPGTFPTAKVIGGADLVGEFYDARGFNAVTRPSCSSTNAPDPDPLDHNGHGSHVAGIAAGTGFGTFPQGVAPGASLFAIKLFSGCALDGTASTSTANVVAAIELATDPDGDGDTDDHVDVINMSLGGAFGRQTEAGSVAANAAVDEGVIVVASAGNGGNIPYITGAPAAAAKAISVAAGNDPGITVQLVAVAGSAGADGSKESLEGILTVPLATSGTKSGTAVRLGAPGSLAAGLCSSLPAGSLEGMIPLIERGICAAPANTFAAKILKAQAAGAIAVVVYNNVPGAGPIVMGGSSAGITIPGVMVGNPDGLAISAAIDADTTFTLDPTNLLPIPNRLQGFTSRGPRFNDAALKPDITAPGGIVSSVNVGSGTGAVSLSGTSMSSPHVAGAAALLRDLHPNWKVKQIKALLMNTAANAESSPGVPYPLSLMGAGRARVDVAVDTESIVLPAAASFGVRERDRTGNRLFEVELEVRNFGSSTKRFTLTSGLLFPSDAEGSITVVHPSTIKVKPHGETEFDLGLRVDFNALAPEAQFEEYDGFLVLTETTSGGDVLRVPFHMVPIARADAGARDDEVELDETSTFAIRNKGIRSTAVDIYQFGVKDRNEDLIDEGPGMPNDPDNWFDIRHTGAHTFPLGTTKVIEFAVGVYGRRSAPSMVETDIFIDVDGGGPDFVAVIGDDFIFGLATAFTGRIVTAIFPVVGAGSLQFVANNDRNQGWQTVRILLSSLNALPGPDLSLTDPDFDYFVMTFDLETGAFDESGTASFNVFSPARDAAPNFFTLDAGASADVTVLGSGSGDLLALYYNNAAGLDQSQRIEIEFDDDDGDDDDDDGDDDDD